MKFFTLLAFATFLLSCSSSEEVHYETRASTPIPTEELIAIGSYSTKAGSYQIAFERAERFCNRWRAAPSVVKKQLRYNGEITEDLNTALNTAGDIARATGTWIPGLGNDDAYETTIIYKCY